MIVTIDKTAVDWNCDGWQFEGDRFRKYADGGDRSDERTCLDAEDADDLVEWLQKMVRALWNDVEADKQRIATLEAQLRWIPVSEKPKGGEAYFIAFLNGEAYDWSYYCDGKWTKLNDDDQRLVTHYKDFNRLPNPPEEKA
jgi:hypothetical protein